MKSILTAFLLSTTFITSANSAEFKLGSAIDAVTVFPRGAEVTRIATGSVDQGDHIIVIENMPGNIDPNSIRVEGVGTAPITIGSVDMRNVLVKGQDVSEQRFVLQEQLDQLNDRLLAFQQDMTDANLQREILENIASKAARPIESSNGIKIISAIELDGLLDSTGKHLKDIAQRNIKSKADIRKTSREIKKVKQQMRRLAPRDQMKTVVEINVTAASKTDGKFNVKYSVNQAGWQPIYDAKLSLESKSAEADLQITRKANVFQQTTENWENIKLTLSTARKTSATTAPEVRTSELDVLKPSPNGYADQLQRGKTQLTRNTAVALESLDGQAEQAVVAAAPAPVEMSFSGFQAEYTIAGLTGIDNTNQTKSVTIGVVDMPVLLTAEIAPRLDPTAYLVANLKIAGEDSYLPGPVFLNRDGAFIGKGSFPLLTPGEEFKLGFGRDDLIRVQHNEVDKKKSEQGFIATVNVDERSFVTEIKYHHDFAMDVKVLDRIPVSNHEDIVVQMLRSSSEPSEKDVDDQRGVLAWNQKMEPGSTTEIKFGYSVEWPQKTQVSGLN